MEAAVLILVISCCLVGSAPIESGAKGEVAEIEKKNFIPMRRFPRPQQQTGYGLSADPNNCQCPPNLQTSYYQQQYQQQYPQQYQQQYQQQYPQQYQQQDFQAPQQRNMLNSGCACRYPSNGRPFYPHHPLPSIEGAPNVIDLKSLSGGILKRPPFWKSHAMKKLNAIKALRAKPKPKPSPAMWVLPPGYGKNGYGFTGWVKAGIPKPNQQQQRLQQQWYNYLG